MGWLSHLLKGSELQHARAAADEARERAEGERTRFERWASRIRPSSPATSATVQAMWQTAHAAYEEGDLPGFQEARAQCERVLAQYRSARSQMVRAHPKEAALELLAEAKRTAEEIRNPGHRSAELTRIAEMQAHAGDVEAARETLGAIGEDADRASVLRTIAIAQAAIAGPAVALAAADELDGDWDRQEVRLSIAEILCRKGDVVAARETAATLTDPEMRARAWRLLAAAEARLGHVDEARSIASEIQVAKWSSAAWSDVAGAQASQGDLKGALETSQRISDPEWRSNALLAVAAVQAGAGDFDAAESMTNRIDDPWFRDDALSEISAARAGRGDLAGALGTLGRIEDRQRRALALVDLAVARKRAGDDENASTLLQRAIEAAGELAFPHEMGDEYPRGRATLDRLAQFVVDAQVRLGEFAAAESTALAVDGEGQRAELLGRLAFALVEHGSGDLTTLEELLDRHEGLLEKLHILGDGAAAVFLLGSEGGRASAEARDARRTARRTRESS